MPDRGTALFHQRRDGVERPARHDSRNRGDAAEAARQRPARIERAPDSLTAVGIPELGRHNADDHQRFRGRLELLPDGTRRIAEPLPREGLRNDDDLLGRLPIVPIDERPSPPRARAEQFEETDGDVRRLDELRLTAAAEEDDLGEGALNAREQVGLLPPLVEQGNREEGPAWPSCSGIALSDFDETFGVAVGNAMEHQRVRRREDE